MRRPGDHRRRVGDQARRGGDGAAKPDGATSDLATDLGQDAPDTGPPPCLDTDNDGVWDQDEGAPALDSDMDGTPDYRDTDSDNDGFSDADEARRNYPGYESRARPAMCGRSSDNCDAPPDMFPNVRDLDSDNDGLTDAEERTAMTNPCAEDTDADGFSDLAETVARSNPRDMASRPPENALYVVLPYYPAGMRGAVEHREFTFQTRIRQGDVFFLVDNSASMEPTIESLRTNLTSVIVPGIRMAIPDVRVGVGSFDSMPDAPLGGMDGVPGSPGDYTLWVRQRLTTDAAAVQTAFNAMHTITQDTTMRYLGGDAPECQVEAMYQLFTGAGSRGHEMDPAAVRSVSNALDPLGNGWVGRGDAARDCPGVEGAFGWACFQDGRVPIVVLFSDSEWYDGPTPSSPLSVNGYRYAAHLAPEMIRRGALFVGVDVARTGMSATYDNSVRLATATHTFNASGAAVVFAARGDLTRIAPGIVSTITTLANETRQDITTRVEPDAMERRLPTGRTTANFVTAVRPVRGMPASPAGYERQDDTTFYNVLPSTQVVFGVDFYNDFVQGNDAAQVFQAAIVVRGRAGSEVDRRPVFIVVPARGGGLPPG